jgi:hypothetical protein
LTDRQKAGHMPACANVRFQQSCALASDEIRVTFFPGISHCHNRWAVCAQ